VYVGNPATRFTVDARPLGFDPDGNARYLLVTRYFDAAGAPTKIFANGNVDWVANRGYVQWQTRMRFGQPAEFDVDAFPKATFHGEVESCSGATGSRFTLLPPDNATGNHTKIVPRIPVRVRMKDLPAGTVLRPGMIDYLTVEPRNRANGCGVIGGLNPPLPDGREVAGRLCPEEIVGIDRLDHERGRIAGERRLDDAGAGSCVSCRLAARAEHSHGERQVERRTPLPVAPPALTSLLWL